MSATAPQAPVLLDRLGKYYYGKDLLLKLEDGTEIFSVDGEPGIMMAVFRPGTEISESELQRQCNISENMEGMKGVMWPGEILYEPMGKAVRGFLSPWTEVPEKRRHISDLVERSTGKYDVSDLAIALRSLFVACNMAQCVLLLLCQDGVKPWTVDPERFIICTEGYAYYYSAYAACLPGPWVGEKYLPPELIDEEESSLRNGKNSVAFSFAYILFELLTGMDPYGPGISDEEERICRKLDGISIYYDEAAPEYGEVRRLLQNLSPELEALFYRTFMYCGMSSYDAVRPDMGEWLAVLDRTLTEIEKRSLAQKH